MGRLPVSQLGAGPLGRDRPHSVGRPRLVPAGTKFQIISFRVHESAPFGESRRIACTGAPVLRTLGPSSFEVCRIDERFTCTGGTFFLAVLSALAPGWPRLGFRGVRPSEGRCLNLVVFAVLRRRERAFWRKLSSRVHGSTGLEGPPTLGTGQHRASTRSAQASTAQSQHRASTGSAQSQHRAGTGPAQGQHRASAEPAQSQRRASTEQVANPSLSAWCILPAWNPCSEFLLLAVQGPPPPLKKNRGNVLPQNQTQNT